jgi:hypothetical protein
MTRLVTTFMGFLLVAAVLAPPTRAQSAPGPSEAFDFGTIGLDDELQHTFEFTNNEPKPLDIENVELTPPLIQNAFAYCTGRKSGRDRAPGNAA